MLALCVKNRHGRPPFEMKRDWKLIPGAKESLKRPWTPNFAKHPDQKDLWKRFNYKSASRLKGDGTFPDPAWKKGTGKDVEFPEPIPIAELLVPNNTAIVETHIPTSTSPPAWAVETSSNAVNTVAPPTTTPKKAKAPAPTVISASSTVTTTSDYHIEPSRPITSSNLYTPDQAPASIAKLAALLTPSPSHSMHSARPSVGHLNSARLGMGRSDMRVFAAQAHHRGASHRGESHRGESHRGESHRGESHRGESHRGANNRGPNHRQPQYGEVYHREEVHRRPNHRRQQYGEAYRREASYSQPSYRQPSYRQPVYRQPGYRQPSYREDNPREANHRRANYEEANLGLGHASPLGNTSLLEQFMLDRLAGSRIEPQNHQKIQEKPLTMEEKLALGHDRSSQSYQHCWSSEDEEGDQNKPAHKKART
ncbi:hypothetical protein BJ875DRAFT_472572 [Amylocarpus encephaloides]|uniref:Uncharacterized protein n=1 Tax=Amylocarpus encephaloides TaxID=45428 RepID=A0A9P7YAX9_9HELO|nr:hypothetical protein BJ875DRAFT_472572 [Amylocarpus encephaloides]